MSGRWRSCLGVVLVVLVCAMIVAGCGGSSASTSRAEVAAVAASEHDFATAWLQANVAAKKRCESRSGQAAARCFQRALEPGERAAEADFSAAVEEILAAGVGSECADALEEALSTLHSVPLFPGAATATCRAESRS